MAAMKCTKLTQDQKERVINLYKKGGPCAEIAQLFNISKATLFKIVAKANVMSPFVNKKPVLLSAQEKQLVLDAYENGESIIVIASRFFVSESCARKVVRQAEKIRPLRVVNDAEKQTIIDAFDCGEDYSVIAKRLKISRATIRTILRASGLSRHKMLSQHQQAMAIESYNNGNSVQCVANQFGVALATVHQLLRRREVKLRPAVRVLIQHGKMNPNWKGGKTTLTKAIRTGNVYNKWRTAVFVRDRAICQHCGSKGHKNQSPLQVDHIYPFSALIRDYKIETLEQAENCAELWDIDNGRTLCKFCHEKTDTYGFKATKYLK